MDNKKYEPIMVRVENTETKEIYEVEAVQWGGETKHNSKRHLDVPLGLDENDHDGLAVFIINDDGVTWKRNCNITPNQEKYIVTILD